MKTFNAVKITHQTLVGSSGPFPRKFGNCFGVESEDGKDYKILNFKVENLEELIKRGELSWPIQCEALSERSAVINDGRIPDDWYQDHFCEVCTPHSLLPLPQRLKQLRDIQRGDRVEHPNGLVTIKIKPVPSRSLKTNWKIEPMVDLQAGDGVEEEITKNLVKEIEKSAVEMPYRGATEWKEGMPKEWKPMFEADGGFFYAPYIPQIKKEIED